MDKHLIATRFSRARGTYNTAAKVQYQVAERMIRYLTATTANRGFKCIMEFGCGTGTYSQKLIQAYHPQTMLLNDLCAQMGENVQHLCQNPNIRFVAGDAERIDFPKGFDLITSCSTIQWFNNVEEFFTRCHDALTHNGVLAFSGFGNRNLYQITQITGSGLHYLPLNRIRDMLSPCFKIILLKDELVTLKFPNAKQVLIHLKQTGVTGIKARLWTRGDLTTFCNEYSRLYEDRLNHQVSLTYHPYYLIATKR